MKPQGLHLAYMKMNGTYVSREVVIKGGFKG